jgi:hypothetical protein
MTMKKLLLLALLFCAMGTSTLFAQNKEEGSLLDQLGEEKTTDKVTNGFKSPRVINSHSMEMLAPATMDFRILHRFGRISDGFYNLFGLDNASMRMGFDFGITKNLMAGIGRSTSKKEIDAFVKYRLLWQSEGEKNMPFSLVWVSGVTRNGLRSPFDNAEIPVTFSNRLSYYHAVIIGRKFSDNFTLQLEPTLVHRNIVEEQQVPNNLYALGVGGRYKFTKRMALTWDYSYILNSVPGRNSSHNPLSIGLDIETGGHVFQLHFSNAVGMNERAYISDENGNWADGQIQFGFNLSRVFQLKKKSLE